MKMMNRALMFSLVAGISYSSGALANIQGEGSYELICRSKAKELAADSYRNCVTESRNGEIDKLKKDYQERLRSLKDEYEKEIDKIGGKTSAKKPASGTKMVAVTQGPKKGAVAIESGANTGHDSMPDESRMDLPEPIPVENMDKN